MACRLSLTTVNLQGAGFLGSSPQQFQELQDRDRNKRPNNQDNKCDKTNFCYISGVNYPNSKQILYSSVFNMIFVVPSLRNLATLRSSEAIAPVRESSGSGDR